MSRNKPTGTRAHGVRTFIVRGAVASLLCLQAGIPAFAEDTTQYQLAISAQPLRTALQEFADQSGMQVVLSLKVKEGYDAPLLDGRYTTATALKVLLQGTGLTYRQLDDKTIEVQPASTAQLIRTADVQGQAGAGGANLLAQNNAAAQNPGPPATADENQLQEVVVTGTRIARQDFTSLSPIVTVDAGSIQNRGDPSVVNALQEPVSYTHLRAHE